MTARTVTGYLCKRCGAESPVGIGYAGTPDVPEPAPGCPNPHAADEIPAELADPGRDEIPVGYLSLGVVALTCGGCGARLTLESDLAGGEDSLRCRACSVTVAHVAGTGDPEVCGYPAGPHTSTCPELA